MSSAFAKNIFVGDACRQRALAHALGPDLVFELCDCQATRPSGTWYGQGFAVIDPCYHYQTQIGRGDVLRCGPLSGFVLNEIERD